MFVCLLVYVCVLVLEYDLVHLSLFVFWGALVGVPVSVCLYGNACCLNVYICFHKKYCDCGAVDVCVCVRIHLCARVCARACHCFCVGANTTWWVCAGRRVSYCILVCCKIRTEGREQNNKNFQRNGTCL